MFNVRRLTDTAQGDFILLAAFAAIAALAAVGPALPPTLATPIVVGVAFTIFMVVIGGISRLERPILDALIARGPWKFFGECGSWYLTGRGLLAIVGTVGFKQGVPDWLRQRHGWSLFPTRHLRMIHSGAPNGAIIPAPDAVPAKVPT